MNYFQSILVVFLFSTVTKVLSQEICGFDAMHHSLTLLDPSYLINISAGNKLIHSLNQKTPNQSNFGNPPYIISVVVHVISPSGSAIGANYNPSLTNIRKSIQNINLALANQGIFNSALGLNSNIQLCLAAIDPTNNPTNGITRTSSTFVEEGVCNPGTNIKNESLIKLLANWDCTRYLNIWLVTNLYSDQQGCSFNGFSYFPYAPCGLDGLMLESNNFQSPKGIEIAIHELGHYLGLYHTFEGGCYNNDCTLDGDQICDTPPDQSPYYADCSTNSCQTELPDILDDNANYMDISDCTPKHFTQGQVDRMHAVLELIRNKLWGSNNCNNSFLNLGLYNVKAIGPICSDTLCLNLFIYNNSDQSINLSTIEIKDSTLIILNQNVNVNVPAHDSIVFATSCIKVLGGLHSIQVTLNKNIPDDDPSDNLYLIKWINYNALNLSLVNLTPTHCISDGTIEVIANGGLAPYIYAINNRINPQTFPYFQLLTTGMYTITSTDRNQCSAMLNVDIPDSCKVPNNKKFIHNKDAFPTGNDCSTLTRELNNQAGSVWYEDKINLTQDFTVNFEFFLGCKDQTGADGIAFVLQPISTAIGVAGGGIGYQNVKPSIEVEFDTWRNPEFNDVGFDHVAIMRNGNNNHLTPDNLAGPVAISNAFVNAEDCKFHKGLVKWISATKRLEVYVECDLRLRYTGDIVKDIFNNDPNVFFGFTSSTGNSNNLQQICLKYVTGANTLPNYSICEGENVQISTRANFKKYLWTPNIDINNPNISNPIFSPKKTMKYYLEITDQCGFSTFDSTLITVLPSSINYKLSYDDSCNVNSKSHLIIIPNPTDTSKLFSLDGITFINQLNYTLDSNSLYTLFHKTGNCIANELLDIHPYSNFLQDTVISLLNVVCNKKGSIFINALGGIPPYKFRLNGLVWQNSGSFDNLNSGTYIYEIMDQTSCIVIDTLIITDNQYAINVNIDSSNFVKTCCSPIAFVALKVNPLNQKYLFNLDNKSWNFSNNFVNLLDGRHKIQVRDEFGCISDTLEFEVSDLRQNYIATNKFQLCNGETIKVGSNIYNTSGIYTDSLKSQYCCDSIIVSELEVYPIFQFQNNLNICEGSQVKVGNNIYNTSGTYMDTLQSIHSCDSIILTNLKVSNISRDSSDYTICKGNSIRVGNKLYSLSGTYIDTLQSQKGCDSILFTKLTVNAISKTNLNYSFCQGDTLNISNKKYFSTGIFLDTLNNVFNCDSLLEININILKAHNIIQSKFICQGESILIGNNQYNSSGQYVDSFQNIYGCDSIVNTQLMVDKLDAELIVDSISCFQSNDGSLEVIFKEGIPDFFLGLNDSLNLQRKSTFNNLSPGNYTISIKDSLGCKKYYSFQLKEPNELNLKLDKEIVIKIGLNNTLNPIINFVPQSIVWSPTKGLSCSDCLNPVSNPTENITYDLTLTDSNGCSVSSRINVIVDFDANIFVPNVFSPNGDLLNDFFQIVADQGIELIELMEIFDRWGERVYYKTKFNANDKSEGWDGTFNGQKLNPSVFSYHIEARKRDGSTISLFGDLTLVR